MNDIVQKLIKEIDKGGLVNYVIPDNSIIDNIVQLIASNKELLKKYSIYTLDTSEHLNTFNIELRNIANNIDSVTRNLIIISNWDMLDIANHNTINDINKTIYQMSNSGNCLVLLSKKSLKSLKSKGQTSLSFPMLSKAREISWGGVFAGLGALALGGLASPFVAAAAIFSTATVVAGLSKIRNQNVSITKEMIKNVYNGAYRNIIIDNILNNIQEKVQDVDIKYIKYAIAVNVVIKEDNKYKLSKGINDVLQKEGILTKKGSVRKSYHKKFKVLLECYFLAIVYEEFLESISEVMPWIKTELEYSGYNHEEDSFPLFLLSTDQIPRDFVSGLFKKSDLISMLQPGKYYDSTKEELLDSVVENWMKDVTD